MQQFILLLKSLDTVSHEYSFLRLSELPLSSANLAVRFLMSCLLKTSSVLLRPGTFERLNTYTNLLTLVALVEHSGYFTFKY